MTPDPLMSRPTPTLTPHPHSNALCAPLASDGSDTLALSFPGTDDLAATAEKEGFAGRVLSFQCFRDEGSGGQGKAV